MPGRIVMRTTAKVGGFLTVLVSSSCYNKITQMRWLKNNHVFLLVLRPRKFKVNVPQIPNLVRSHYLVDGCHFLAVSSYGADQDLVAFPLFISRLIPS